MADKIASLTTIATAHRGTTFMTWAHTLLPVFRLGGKLLKGIEDLKRWLGLRSSDFYYHFLQGYDCSSEQMKQALYPLTLKGAAEFNAALAEQEHLLRKRPYHTIMYRAYGGRVARVRLPFLRPSHVIISWFGNSEERRFGNDGAASVWSAHYPWQEDDQPSCNAAYIQTVPFDHYEQVNWNMLDRPSIDPLPHGLHVMYDSVVQNILQIEFSHLKR
jgi:hypothetical protein